MEATTTMKKLMVLVGTLVVSTVASATSLELPFLEYERAPIHGLGTNQVYVRVLNNGQVHGYVAQHRFVSQWKLLATLPAYQMNRLRQLVARAAKAPALVAPVGSEVTCAAVPSHQDTYRAPQYNLVLEQSANPCGGVRYNDTRSSLEVVQLLNGYRDILNQRQ